MHWWGLIGKEFEDRLIEEDGVERFSGGHLED